MPWVWVRRRLAERWGVPPWEVDEAPYEEIALELKLGAIEHEMARKRRRSASGSE